MVFKALKKRNPAHEQVIFCSHSETGLKAIIAIHSTTLGPALGGCRMLDYESEEMALEDVLRLSEAMSYKAAMAGLPLGGGKSVIIGNPERIKSPELLWAFGSHIEALKGRYIGGKDMGINTQDLQYMSDQSSYILGRPVARGGVGDPSRSTAQGVYYGIKKAVKWRLKKDSLKGVKVLIHGLGAVGWSLMELLQPEGVELMIHDIKSAVIDKVKKKFPDIQVLSLEQLWNSPCDVFAPCSIGGIINEKTVKALQCSIIAGGANNQLSDVSIEEKLKEKNILYIPDFIINSGGLIYISSYLSPKKSNEWIENKILGIGQTIERLFELSSTEGKTLGQMAILLAKEKIKRAQL